VRVLIDYRAALREPSGVGEYTHEVARALLKRRKRGSGADSSIDLTLFSSSWKDRLLPSPDLADAAIVDRRVPVRVLNFAWHRLEWPGAETLTGETFDVVQSMHPLLMPSRHAAQVVTICDLNFLTNPERTRAEIRRDYAELARAHAARADRVIVISDFTRREVQRLLDVPADRISMAVPGAPAWPAREHEPQDGYLLFFGTLEPRKNIGALLDAYEMLSVKHRDLPPLVLAGHATEAARPWLERINRPPLAGRVRHVGYVSPGDRQTLYQGARLLVHPAHEEGFGLTVLEAMTVGVPVVAANRGALPEVGGDAVVLADPDQPDALAGAIERVLGDSALSSRLSTDGRARSRLFSWDQTAESTCTAYAAAVARRSARRGAA